MSTVVDISVLRVNYNNPYNTDVDIVVVIWLYSHLLQQFFFNKKCVET